MYFFKIVSNSIINYLDNFQKHDFIYFFLKHDFNIFKVINIFSQAIVEHINSSHLKISDNFLKTYFKPAFLSTVF